jgi:peptidoglycan hydrolase-like protein with peptidoglycan-binding domain
MKLLKWMLAAFLSCVLCVVCVFLVRKAVTPSQPPGRMAPVASTQVPSRVPIETVANTSRPPARQASATPVIPPAPIGNLPAPAVVVRPKATAAAPTPAADTVAAATPAPTPSPTPQFTYDPAVQRAQKFLAELGYEVGKADGKLGPRTAAALEAFQRDHALARTKQADEPTLAKLEEEAKRAAIAKLTAAPTATPAALAAAAAKAQATSGTAAPATTTAALPVRRSGEPQVLVVRGGPKQPDLGHVPALDNKSDVARLQRALADAGFYKGEVDGRWGKESLAALQEFQKSLGQKPTTRIDAPAWEKLVTAAGPTPTPLPDLLVVAPVSKTLKKTKLPERLAWYTPSAEAIATPAVAAASRPATHAAPAPRTQEQAAAPAAAKSVAADAAPAHQPTPIIRPAAAPVAPAPSNDLAAPGAQDSPEKLPASAVPTPAALGSSLNVASATPVQFAPNATAKTGSEAPVLVPQSPNARRSATYAEATLRPAATEARVETVAHDKDPARLLAQRGDRATTDATASDPDSLSARLRAAARELNQPPAKSKREQAQEKVRAVESAYNDLRKRWTGKFSSGAVADQITAVESGFKTMKADLDKGQYDRIIERGDGFKRAIEIVDAHAYVASALSKPQVRAKLSKSDLEAIEALRREAERYPERLEKQEKFLDAATLIRARAGNISAAASGNGSSDRSGDKSATPPAAKKKSRATSKRS